ncbi:ComEA family DNA-binding protein [Dickeya dianthicola]|uniref:ComEA family DNA-binding protein n=1 Tax=Dickeya dianthicola TaxID=204039 RepID=UPI00039C836D|nr:helix-hairpin-helix domain-containing protein [Dickeya dianthicola]MCI4029571.1 helix-hairpin-helix domain-containing protein [Dickeya dianthicola]MCI4174738.1 helix-hairpin-helix domain-containing protein [Dickeya dianthicola]MCI4176252.1 helix-hairpin-helix domain-containing protein [Dickeya dianthicola]MCI4180985.1 helix-hairpin-helix domain-containing protein [Dickeya dianthicola]MCI4193656.1 helix-hairpin-helix domain-containing protein [Dickeya dianthicola]
MKKSGIKALCLIVGMSFSGVSTWLHASPAVTTPDKPGIAAVKPASPEQKLEKATRSATDEEEVSINTATAEQLAVALNGVGLKKAQAIVSYREQNGPFTQLEQLQEVPGIGNALIERNQSHLRL